MAYEDASVSVSRPLYRWPISEQRQPSDLCATHVSAWHRQIIKEPQKAQLAATGGGNSLRPYTKMRTFENAVPLITQGTTEAKCAAT